MSNRTKSRPTAARRAVPRKPGAPEARQRAKRRLLVGVGAAVLAAVAVLFFISRSSGGGGGGAEGPQFVVGDPGPGQTAPPIRLPSTAGGTWDLSADGAGKTTLLYFQEGVMCQPCWDQIHGIEDDFADFQALGIDQMVTITVDPLDQLAQKLSDEGLQTPGLSDPNVSLGPSYTANQYGMMGEGMYGHTFVVVGPDGQILWRGDYGGPPDHTMYVSPSDLLDDLRAGLAETSQ